MFEKIEDVPDYLKKIIFFLIIASEHSRNKKITKQQFFEICEFSWNFTEKDSIEKIENFTVDLLHDYFRILDSGYEP